MTVSTSIDRTGLLVIVGVFVALVVDGMDLQILALALLTAAYLPVLVYAATPANVASLLLLFGFLDGAPYAINSTSLSESFPADIRATGWRRRTASVALGPRSRPCSSA